MTLIRVPLAFYWDHVSRDLPAPNLVRRTKTHGWVDREDPDLTELIDDAEFYTDAYGPSGYGGERGLRSAAHALLRALKKEVKT